MNTNNLHSNNIASELDSLPYHTATEIAGQPNLWKLISEELKSNKKEFERFLATAKHNNVVLTGAGSSAFIGESVEHVFTEQYNGRSLSTTTLLTHFDYYIKSSDPLLLISFARSGNSPESNAVVDLAEQKCSTVYHIAITCNESGELAQKVSKLKNGLSLVLPPESEDKALAMTGSFTGMLLSALLIAENPDTPSLINVDTISEQANKFITSSTDCLKQLAETNFKRIVFLGSGPLEGIARESHLKVQELTDGQIIGKFDSFLGFRHGPKAVLDNHTLVVFLFSSDPHVFAYERDLANDITENARAMNTIGVFSYPDQMKEVPMKHSLLLNEERKEEPSVADILPYVLPAQILGLFKSLNLGLNPDNPSTDGSISRVVEGVTIYPMPEKNSK